MRGLQGSFFFFFLLPVTQSQKPSTLFTIFFHQGALSRKVTLPIFLRATLPLCLLSPGL